MPRRDLIIMNFGSRGALYCIGEARKALIFKTPWHSLLNFTTRDKLFPVSLVAGTDVGSSPWLTCIRGV